MKSIKRFSLKDHLELSTDEVTKISKNFLHHLELMILANRQKIRGFNRKEGVYNVGNMVAIQEVAKETSA